jgi:hypothetical protein
VKNLEERKDYQRLDSSISSKLEWIPLPEQEELRQA